LKIINCKEFSIYQADSNNPSYLVKVNLLDNEEKQSFLKAIVENIDNCKDFLQFYQEIKLSTTEAFFISISEKDNSPLIITFYNKETKNFSIIGIPLKSSKLPIPKVLISKITKVTTFVEIWNDLTKKEIKINDIMYSIFNIIQFNYGNPLIAIKYNKNNEYLLRNYDSYWKEVEKEFKNIKKFSPIFHEYLLMRNPNLNRLFPRSYRKRHLIKGLDEVFILIQNKKGNTPYFVRNYRSLGSWNPRGYESNIFKGKGTGKTIETLFLHKISINDLTSTERADIIETLNSKVPGPKIGSLVKYKSKRSYKVEGPKYVYKFKYQIKKIDEMMHYLWWIFIGGDWAKGTLAPAQRELNDYLKEKRINFIEDIQRNSIKVASNLETFEIYVVDKSKALKSFVEKLAFEIGWMNEKGLIKEISAVFWDLINNYTLPGKKNKVISTIKLGRLWQESLLEHLEILNKKYSVREASIADLGPISKKPMEFWDEGRKDSFTRVIAAMIQDKVVREKIREKIGIKLVLNVKVVESGHFRGKKSLPSKPDLLIYRKRNRTIFNLIEQVQVKIKRPIGYGVGEIKIDDFLLDFLKTIDYIGEKEGSNIIPYQIEVIKMKETLNNKTDCAISSNAAILSYWEKTSIQGRRIGDLISAIYLSGWGGNKRKQNELLKDVSSLLAECTKQMFSGTDLLMGTERIPLNAKQIELIIDSLEINPIEGSTKFLRKALITTLKEIYEVFVNDDL